MFAERGQLDFESILWGNNLGVSRISDKAGKNRVPGSVKFQAK